MEKLVVQPGDKVYPLSPSTEAGVLLEKVEITVPELKKYEIRDIPNKRGQIIGRFKENNGVIYFSPRFGT